MIFVATKHGTGRTKKIFPPPLLELLLDPGSGMDKNQDPGCLSRNTEQRKQLLNNVY
jgi:hypothetical protein